MDDFDQWKVQEIVKNFFKNCPTLELLLNHLILINFDETYLSNFFWIYIIKSKKPHLN